MTLISLLEILVVMALFSESGMIPTLILLFFSPGNSTGALHSDVSVVAKC